MKRNVFAIFTTFLICITPDISVSQEPILLPDALQQSRDRALRTLQLQADLAVAKANILSADAPHDTILFGRALWQEDRTESASAFAGSRRNALIGETGIRKLFPKATALETKIGQKREFTKFPPPQPGAPSASAFQGFNPSYRHTAEFSVSQPLWRNWMGREFRMQKDLLNANVAPAELNLLLQEQMIQAEVEQYYWNLADFEAQLALTDKLISVTQQFAALMRERVKYGRADQVDVADAEAAIVTQEGRYLDLVFAAQHYRRQIRMAMDPAAMLPEDVTGPTPVYLPRNILQKRVIAHKADTPESAYQYALENRIDLKLLAEQRQPLRAQLDLAKEQGKPSISVFGGAGKAGLEWNMGRSVGDAYNDGKHFFYNLGIEAEINLQKSDVDAKKQTVTAQLASLDAQTELIKSNARREVEFAYAGLEAARRKRLQAIKSIESLKAKRRAELKKFKQARSEEIVLLSYDLEILAAEAELIAADKLARDSDVRLRAAMHAYPSGK